VKNSWIYVFFSFETDGWLIPYISKGQALKASKKYYNHVPIHFSGIVLRGKECGSPSTLNLGANCMFSKFKIKIQDKFYPTKLAV
jgi:hypothetical protein